MANISGTIVQTMAELLAEGMEITDVNAIIWINEFLRDQLRAKAMIRDTQTYPNSIAYTEYTIPSDCEEIFKVDSYADSGFLETNRYGEYFAYELSSEGKLLFLEDGHYKMHFFNLPTAISAIAGDIAIDPCFNEPMYLWVAFRALTHDDEDNAQQGSLGLLRHTEYRVALNESIATRKKKVRKSHRIRRV